MCLKLLVLEYFGLTQLLRYNDRVKNVITSSCSKNFRKPNMIYLSYKEV